MTNVRHEGTPQHQKPEQTDVPHSGKSGAEKPAFDFGDITLEEAIARGLVIVNAPNSLGEHRDPTNTPQTERFTPLEDPTFTESTEPTDEDLRRNDRAASTDTVTDWPTQEQLEDAPEEPQQHSRRGFLKWVIGGAAALAVGGTAYKVTRPQATTAPAPTAPKPTSATTPSAPTSAAPTESSAPTESASSNSEKFAAQLEKQEAMTPETFFEQPKADQMIFLGAVLEKAKQFQEGYYDVNLPVGDEAKQLYNFNPLLNEKAPQDMSDQDIVNQYLHNLQAAYHGTKLDAKGELYKSHDLDTSLKTSMLVAYYPEGSDFRNLLANLEAYGSSDGNLNGTITADNEKSETTLDNTDREGNEHMSRRVNFKMKYTQDGEEVSAADAINFFWVEGKLKNGDTFGTWIPYNK